MDIKVHCPNGTCRATLTVPLTAAGHVARCPLCHDTFLVPTQEEIAEQTASSWIENDIEDLEEQSDRKWQQTLKEEALHRAKEEELKRQQTAREIEKILVDNQQQALKNQTDISTTKTAPIPLVPPASEPALPTEKPAPTQRPETPSAGGASPNVDTSQAVKEPLHSHETIAPKPLQTLQQSEPRNYPSKRGARESRPYLFVTQCTQSGVVLSFDSHFLEHEAFRLSMPVTCAYTGETDPNRLIAKPMAFLDQPCGDLRNAYDVEAGHEAKPSQKQSPREMLERMGVIEQFKKPFRFPMPYYVRSDHSNESLKCTTSRTGEGPILAHILIPNGPVAIDWLHNVNGICGPEYELLQKDVDRLWQNEWTDLDETVRHRIQVWAHFQEGEKFRYFISDADMLKKDEGLAGVVFTDRRLIYKKFHRQGQFELGANAQLIIRPDGTMAGLRVKTPESTFKCARFHFKDLQKLKNAASDLGFGLDISR